MAEQLEIPSLGGHFVFLAHAFCSKVFGTLFPQLLVVFKHIYANINSSKSTEMPKTKSKTGEKGKPPGDPEPQPELQQGWPVTPEFWVEDFPAGYCKFHYLNIN